MIQTKDRMQITNPLPIENLDALALAKLIDHTLLKPVYSPAEIERLCNEALEYHFAAVMVHPAAVSQCAVQLKGSSTKVGSVVSFPFGQSTLATKVFEIREIISSGAHDIDMVINQAALKCGEHEILRDELAELAAICREHGALSKVILECCNLTDQEKIRAAELAVEAGCDFVKTSTGFGSGGATVEDVSLLRSVVGDRCGVKASGGIRSLEAAISMVRAGANRLGTSSGVQLIAAVERN